MINLPLKIKKAIQDLNEIPYIDSVQTDDWDSLAINVFVFIQTKSEKKPIYFPCSLKKSAQKLIKY